MPQCDPGHISYGVAGPGFGVSQTKHGQVNYGPEQARASRLQDKFKLSVAARRPGDSGAGTGKSCTAQSRPGQVKCGPEQARASRLHVECVSRLHVECDPVRAGTQPGTGHLSAAMIM